MIEETRSHSASLPLTALERIESVCLEFEGAWKKGTPPRIEDYVGAVQGSERRELFRELLLLDLDYRSRSDERPLEGEYQARFPQDSQLVSDVFREMSTSAAVTETGPSPPVPVSGGQSLPCPFGDYELLEVLGEGGMGVVYRARQRTPDRIVALKIIRPDRLAAVASERREKVVERFHVETQAAAHLEHERIVPVYEVGQVEDQPFYSMRYIPGRGLEQVVRDGPLAGQDAAVLLEPVARALHYAHSRNIVHRDIKPRNILLDTEGKPYVVDFGLAKWFAAAQDLTQTAEAVGTPAYMSPEQARSQAGVDRRTDVYSLGATLYELLTGRPPFCAATAAETQRQVIENQPVPPRQLNPAIDRDLETICLKCLEKEPARRYATAEELADELTRYQQGRPIQARPITPMTRVWRWCRRNRRLAASGTLAAALSLFLIVAGPIVALHQASLRRDAVSSAERANRLADEKTKLLTQTEQLLREKSVALDETRAAQRQTRRALYVAELNLIPFHWELGNTGEVQRLLDDQLPRGDEEDLREFVWRYWSHRLQTRQTTEPIPTPMPFAVNTVISPDGRRIAFASTTGKVHVRRWNASPDAPDEFVLTASGRFPGIGGVAFLPDGETIAIREAQQVTLWNLAQQPATSQVLTLGASMESSLGRNTFSNNGRYLTVTRGSDCEVWDLVEQKPVAKVTLPVQSINLRHLGVSDDGEKLITSTGTLWNLKQDRAEYSLPSQLYMDGVAFSPTGEGLVTLGGPAMRLSLWDRAGRERVLAEHVGVFAVSPTRREVCWATTRNVQVLRLEGAVQPRVFPYRGIRALRYDPNGKDLLALDLYHLYRLPLDSVDPDAPVVLFAEQRGAEPRGSDYAALSPGGTCYAAALSGEIRVWETTSGRLLSQFKARRPQAADSLAIDNAVRGLVVGDNREVVTCSFLGDIEVWDGGTGQHVETLAQSGKASTSVEAIHRGLGAVAASSDVQVVAAMRLDGAVVVWNRAKKHQAKLSAGTHTTRPLNLSPDGKFLRTLGKAGGATVWDLHRLEAVPDARNWDHLFLFGDRWAFPSVSQDGTIEIHDFASGERVQRLGVHAGLTAIAATPDAKNIATLSGDGTLIIWDARLSAPLLTVEGTPGSSDSQSLVSRHTFDPSLARLAFVDEGHALALFQREGRVRYWRLRLPANSARPASTQAGPRVPTWTAVPGNPAM